MYSICAIVNNFLLSYLYLSISMSISYVNTVTIVLLQKLKTIKQYIYSHKFRWSYDIDTALF